MPPPVIYSCARTYLEVGEILFRVISQFTLFLWIIRNAEKETFFLSAFPIHMMLKDISVI